MKALVIAGNSFVGRHLCRSLRAHGAKVVATGRGEEVGFCDIRDAQNVGKLIRDTAADCVFQCAALTAPDASVEEMNRVHVTGTLNVLSAAAEFTPNALLMFLGSAAEYGEVNEARLPVNEDQRANPASLFGASKAAQTQVAFAAAVEWKLRVLVARPFNILGPGLPELYLAASLAKRLLREGPAAQPLTVPNADATRDFVDVRDVAEALVALAEKAVPARGNPCLYNVASGEETTVLEIARLLCDLHGGRSAVAIGSTESRSRICRSCGDATRLRDATAWQPRVGLRESVRDLWNEKRMSEPRPLGNGLSAAS